jgi:hypothetical protein
LESKNGQIKDVFTIRERMEIALFLDLHVHRNWSQDATTKEYEFRESFKVTDKCYE